MKAAIVACSLALAPALAQMPGCSSAPPPGTTPPPAQASDSRELQDQLDRAVDRRRAVRQRVADLERQCVLLEQQVYEDQLRVNQAHGPAYANPVPPPEDVLQEADRTARRAVAVQSTAIARAKVGIRVAHQRYTRALSRVFPPPPIEYETPTTAAVQRDVFGWTPPMLWPYPREAHLWVMGLGVAKSTTPQPKPQRPGNDPTGTRELLRRLAYLAEQLPGGERPADLAAEWEHEISSVAGVEATARRHDAELADRFRAAVDAYVRLRTLWVEYDLARPNDAARRALHADATARYVERYHVAPANYANALDRLERTKLKLAITERSLRAAREDLSLAREEVGNVERRLTLERR